MKGWSGTLEASVEAALAAAAASQAAAVAAQATADDALEDAAVVWSEVVFTMNNLGGVAPVTAALVAPVTGTLESMAISSTGAPNANLVVAASIGGVGVTGGTATQLSGDAAGVIRTATATAANAVTALATSVLLTATATGNTTALRSTVLVGFRRG